MEAGFAYPPIIKCLPVTMPAEGALCIELKEGIPFLFFSLYVQQRIETLLIKNREFGLSESEKEELDRYEEIDDYLSFINRIIRNLYKSGQSDIYGLSAQNIVQGATANP